MSEGGNVHAHFLASLICWRCPMFMSMHVAILLTASNENRSKTRSKVFCSLIRAVFLYGHRLLFSYFFVCCILFFSSKYALTWWVGLQSKRKSVSRSHHCKRIDSIFRLRVLCSSLCCQEHIIVPSCNY